jgi:hypothetical protein
MLQAAQIAEQPMEEPTDDVAEMFLSDAQIRHLTGCAHKARQVEQLRKMGLPFWINARGQAIVTRAAVEGRPVPPPPKPKWVPRLFRDGANADLTPYLPRRGDK